MHFCSRSVMGLMFAAALSLPAQTASNPIHLTVDLTEAPRKILHARMTIPVSPGPLTLLYPKWIPGEHMPDGPIDDLAGLFITANGQQLSWMRDDVNMYAIHLTVPEGVTELDVKDDFLATAGATNLLLVTFLLPVSSLVLGTFILAEPIVPTELLGMALIGLGLVAIDGRWPQHVRAWMRGREA